MDEKKWADILKESHSRGICSLSDKAKKAAKIKPRINDIKENHPVKDLPYVTYDDFENEHRRIQNYIFQQKIDEYTTKPKAKLPEKFDVLKCIEYILDNGVSVAKFDDGIIIYQPTNGVWYFLDSKIGQRILNSNIPKEVMEKFDLEKCKKIYESIDIYPNLEVRTVEPDPDRKFLLNFLDGVYDSRTGEIFPHSPDYMFFYCIQAKASDIADNYNSPLLQSYLKNSLGDDKSKIATLQEILGVAISTIRDQKIAFFLLGKSNSGKSVIINVMEQLLKGFVSNVSFAQLNGKFAPSLLLGKWLNTSGEMSDLSDNRIQTFKNVVGNDGIMTSFKGKDGFTLRNNALLVFGANEMPSVSKIDQAYFNRLRILSYDVSVPKEKWVDDLAKRLYCEETGYILRFAIDGLLHFIKNGMDLTYKETSDILVKNYQFTCNSFIEFTNVSIRFSPGRKLKSKDIRSAYERYCKRNGVKVLAANLCSTILKELFDTEGTTIGHSDDKGYTNLVLICDHSDNE